MKILAAIAVVALSALAGCTVTTQEPDSNFTTDPTAINPCMEIGHPEQTWGVYKTIPDQFKCEVYDWNDTYGFCCPKGVE